MPTPSLPTFGLVKPFKLRKKGEVSSSGTFGTAGRLMGGVRPPSRGHAGGRSTRVRIPRLISTCAPRCGRYR